jgi:Flp pilus assembly protein TadD
MKRLFFIRSLRRRRLRYSVLIPSIVLAAVTSGCSTSSVEHHSHDAWPVMRDAASTSMSDLRIAEAALNAGNLDVARMLFSRVLKRDPDSVTALTGLGNTFYAAGDDTRAAVYFERANKMDAQAVSPHIGMGRVAIRQRRFDDAIAIYHTLLSRASSDPLAWAGFGVALDLKGDHAGAQAVFRNALASYPGDPMLSLDLGLSLVLSGHVREGANVLLDVTRFPGAPPQARQNLALAYGLLGNEAAAAEILAKDLPKASITDNLRFYELRRNAAWCEPLPATKPKEGHARDSAITLERPRDLHD